MYIVDLSINGGKQSSRRAIKGNGFVFAHVAFGCAVNEYGEDEQQQYR